MIEVVSTSEMSVCFQETTQHYIPESCNLQTYRHLDGIKLYLEAKHRLDQDRGTKPGRQSPRKSKHKGLATSEIACMGKAWLVKPQG